MNARRGTSARWSPKYGPFFPAPVGMFSAHPRNAMHELPRVLIVDDEMGVRESLRAILENDCEVLTATSGEEALRIVGHKPVDVMTLDLRMPGLTGIEVLERAKSLDPDLEVLIITGYGSLDTAVAGVRFRAFDYLTKPFDVDHVRRVVQRALGRRLAAQRLKTVPDRVLSAMSHEFRTPLNVIMGYSTMIQDDGAGSLSADQRLALDRIQSNSNVLLLYVETLFYMAELDRGALPLALTPVRLADVLARVGAELAPRVSEKGLCWRLDVPANLYLTTDEEKLVRLVRAFADNAVRFTQEGEIVIMARPTANGAMLEVRDTGPGVAPDLILETEDVVAGRDELRPPRLLGFGLRLAGRLVRALQGSLTMAASPAGTTCALVLPDLAAMGDFAARATA